MKSVASDFEHGESAFNDAVLVEPKYAIETGKAILGGKRCDIKFEPALCGAEHGGKCRAIVSECRETDWLAPVHFLVSPLESDARLGQRRREPSADESRFDSDRGSSH